MKNEMSKDMLAGIGLHQQREEHVQRLGDTFRGVCECDVWTVGVENGRDRR